MGAFVDLTGQKFTHLTVISRATNAGRYVSWNVQCVCGIVFAANAQNLTGGSVKSCGCRSNEMRSLNNPRNKGITSDYAYKSFKMMKTRCTNPNYTNYAYYGGRGIKVDDSMLTFEGFKQVMGDRPRGYTIDRIHPDGNYEPGNVRWASRAEQSKNRRNVTVYNVGSEQLTISDLARQSGKSIKFFRNHLLGKAETIDDVLSSIPPKFKCSVTLVTHWGTNHHAI